MGYKTTSLFYNRFCHATIKDAVTASMIYYHQLRRLEDSLPTELRFLTSADIVYEVSTKGDYIELGEWPVRRLNNRNHERNVKQ